VNDEIIYGINPVREALRGRRRAFELFVARDVETLRLEKIIALAAEKGVPVRQRDKHDLARICATDHHQGIALRIEPFPYAELEDIEQAWRNSGTPGLVLVLDTIQDPHNLGALIRSAACAGAHGVIIPKDRAAAVTSAVEKTSAGAVETLPIARVANINQALKSIKEWGFWVYGAVGEAGSSVYSQDYTGHVALVIGSEGEGLRDLVRKNCDVLVAIPMQGGVSSLNASVAGGICLFEVVRQRVASLT
jgi:23S rRNA (guanosine2251-2'-O)-methyltransferase